MTNDRLRLAALRASHTAPLPHDRDELGALRAAAGRAGRRLVDVRAPGREPELIMGWILDNALTPDDPGGPAKPPEGSVLALAACVCACWPDPDQPLYPGGSTTVAEITAALAPLGVKNVTRALNHLRAHGFLVQDTADGAVRLGPEIALWRDTDIGALRREYHQLPVGRSRGDR